MLSDGYVTVVQEQALEIEWDTGYPYADYLSAVPYLHETLGGQTSIRANITVVQEAFGKAFKPVSLHPAHHLLTVIT